MHISTFPKGPPRRKNNNRMLTITNPGISQPPRAHTLVGCVALRIPAAASPDNLAGSSRAHPITAAIRVQEAAADRLGSARRGGSGGPAEQARSHQPATRGRGTITTAIRPASRLLSPTPHLALFQAHATPGFFLFAWRAFFSCRCSHARPTR